MKKLLILLLFSPALLFSNDFSTTFGFLNDNYTGSVDNGENGRYLGADDFLTFSFFNISSYKKFDFYTSWRVVTSRKYSFRYDLLNLKSHYSFNYRNFSLSPMLGLLYRGNLGGGEFQNDFHDFRDLPLVDLEYLNSSGLSLQTGFDAEYLINDYFTANLNTELPFYLKPASTMFSVSYNLDNRYLNFQALAGYRYNFNRVDYYSEFTYSGFNTGVKLDVKLPYKLLLTSGVYFFPGQNLQADTTYAPWNHKFSPQFWVGLSYNSTIIQLIDIMKL